MKNKEKNKKEDFAFLKAKSKMKSRQDSNGSYTGVPVWDADEVIQDADDL